MLASWEFYISSTLSADSLLQYNAPVRSWGRWGGGGGGGGGEAAAREGEVQLEIERLRRQSTQYIYFVFDDPPLMSVVQWFEEKC